MSFASSDPQPPQSGSPPYEALKKYRDYLQFYFDQNLEEKQAEGPQADPQDFAALQQQVTQLKERLEKQNPTNPFYFRPLYAQQKDTTFVSTLKECGERCKLLFKSPVSLDVTIAERGLQFTFYNSDDISVFKNILKAHDIAYYDSLPGQSGFMLTVPNLHVKKLLHFLRFSLDETELNNIVTAVCGKSITDALKQNSVEQLKFVIQRKQFGLALGYVKFLSSKSKKPAENKETSENLDKYARASLNHFLSVVNKAKLAITRYAAVDPAFKQRLQSLESKEDQPLHIVLQQIMRVMPTDAPSSSQSQAYRAARAAACDALNDAFSVSQNLHAWCELRQELGPSSLGSSHTYQLCKRLTPNNVRHFLRAPFPLNEFDHLKKFYQKIHGQSAGENKVDAKSILKTICAIPFCETGKDLIQKESDFDKQKQAIQTQMGYKSVCEESILPGFLGFNGIQQHRQYLSYPSLLPEDKDTLDDKMAVFSENIADLKFCSADDSDGESKEANAFSAFHTILQGDTQTAGETKKIIAKHFNKMVGKFITGEITSLENINQFDADLKQDLVGKPPMSPKLKAAVGVLLGALTAAVIVLSGGTAVVAFAAGAAGSATLGGAGFFHARKQSAKHEKEYKDKLTHVQLAINRLCNKGLLS